MTMSKQMDVESPTKNRRQPLLLAKAMGVKEEKHGRKGNRIGEVAGGTAAECAAVCCCPCAMMHLLVLAVYKVPTGLCKKALRKSKRKRLLRRKKENSLEENQRRSWSTGITGGWDEPAAAGVEAVGIIEAVDLDTEMLDVFYGAGFWRSSSRKED